MSKLRFRGIKWFAKSHKVHGKDEPRNQVYGVLIHDSSQYTEASWQISYKYAKHFGGYLECYVFSKEWVSQKKIAETQSSCIALQFNKNILLSENLHYYQQDKWVTTYWKQHWKKEKHRRVWHGCLPHCIDVSLQEYHIEKRLAGRASWAEVET